MIGGMRMLLPLLVLVAAAGTVPPAAADDVTLYRCTDAAGRVAIQDFPCADGEDQQARTIPRPQDPPPRPEGPATPAPAPAAPPPATAEVVVRAPPRPMFECTTPGGETYLSDSGDGNPRPAPVWYPAGPWTPPGVAPGPRPVTSRRESGIASPGMSTSPGARLTTPPQQRQAPPPPARRGHRGHRHPGFGHAYGGGLIRDQCQRLPQARTCSVLTDRRTEIRRRMFNAQPTERAELREEERDITARLNEDCDIR